MKPVVRLELTSYRASSFSVYLTIIAGVSFYQLNYTDFILQLSKCHRFMPNAFPGVHGYHFNRLSPSQLTVPSIFGLMYLIWWRQPTQKVCLMCRPLYPLILDQHEGCISPHLLQNKFHLQNMAAHELISSSLGAMHHSVVYRIENDLASSATSHAIQKHTYRQHSETPSLHGFLFVTLSMFLYGSIPVPLTICGVAFLNALPNYVL